MTNRHFQYIGFLHFILASALLKQKYYRLNKIHIKTFLCEFVKKNLFVVFNFMFHYKIFGYKNFGLFKLVGFDSISRTCYE